jgi:transketolase
MQVKRDMDRDYGYFRKIARDLRVSVLDMVFAARSGHLGGALSIIEVMTALYFDEMRYDPAHPDDPGRDRFVLSKGHTAPALYATLAHAGFFPKERLFDSFRSVNSLLQGHPDMKKTPGVDMTSGSLGIGLSAAAGMALSAKIRNVEYKVYCMIGDGELDEGQIWEAAATASFQGLDNLIAFVDLNGLQNDDLTSCVKDLGDIPAKWRAFGWDVQEVDGHSFEELLPAIDRARENAGRPSVIICRTVKGKGISFMENAVVWHGKTPTDAEYRAARAELLA